MRVLCRLSQSYHPPRLSSTPSSSSKLPWSLQREAIPFLSELSPKHFGSPTPIALMYTVAVALCVCVLTLQLKLPFLQGTGMCFFFTSWLVAFGSGWPVNTYRTCMTFFPGTGMASFHHEAFRILLTPHCLCLDSFIFHFLSMWTPTRLDTETIAGDFVACETTSTPRRVGPWHSHMSPESSRNPAPGK